MLPLITYGVSYHHEDFSGTLSVSPETLARLVYEIGMCAARCGVTKLVIINGHGGNAPALHLAAQMINRDAHIFTCVDTGETSDTDIDEMIDTPNDVHAGEIETSTTLAVRPELVKMAKAPRMIPRFSSRYLDFTSKRSVGWYAHTEKISRSGVMGDATKATAEKGERIWEVMIRAWSSWSRTSRASASTRSTSGGTEHDDEDHAVRGLAGDDAAGRAVLRSPTTASTAPRTCSCGSRRTAASPATAAPRRTRYVTGETPEEVLREPCATIAGPGARRARIRCGTRC